MRDFIVSLLAATAMGIGAAQAQSAVERLDPALDALVASDTKVERSTRTISSLKAPCGTTDAREAFSPSAI